MSEIKVNSIKGVSASTAAISIDNSSGTCTAKLTDNGGNQFANRNKIINGEFRVNQRNHSGSAGHNTYTLDRWKYARSANSEFSTSQSTDTPDGFANSIKLDCISANGSTGAGDYAYLRYHIEGQDLQDLSKGTSAAKAFTLSFYVKCDITGTFAISIEDVNSRMCNATYTVSNTNWNRYIITIPADTTGALANNNLTQLSVHFYIIAGSSHSSGSAVHTWGAYSASSVATGHTANIVSTDHNWYMTGVQLEISDYATPFEHRSYGQELALCQRYYFHLVSGNDKLIGLGMNYGNPDFFAEVTFPVTMRAAPSLDITTGTNYYRMYQANSSGDDMDSFVISRANTNKCNLYDSGSGGSIGKGGVLVTNNASASVAFSSEL